MTLSVRVDAEVVARLDEIADRTGESRSEVAERCVKRALPSIDEAIKVMDWPVVGGLLAVLLRDPDAIKRAESIRKSRGRKSGRVAE